jgi:hypothetical protein
MKFKRNSGKNLAYNTFSSIVGAQKIVLTRQIKVKRRQAMGRVVFHLNKFHNAPFDNQACDNLKNYTINKKLKIEKPIQIEMLDKIKNKLGLSVYKHKCRSSVL